MKVSIITVVYNGAKTLNSCIDSVLSQNYKDIEYILVDGNSSDGTQEIVKSYGPRIQKFVSEPDLGIYDAMNKGINIASGDLIGIINADDIYVNSDVIEEAVVAIKSETADACYGDLEYVDASNLNIIKRKWRSGVYKNNAFLNGWMPPHPTFFIRKDFYKKYGMFRLDMGSAADYELMLRMVHKNGARLAYVPHTWVKMRVGGVSNSTLGNRLKANRNDRKAWEVNNLKPRLYTLLMKPARKIFQFLT